LIGSIADGTAVCLRARKVLRDDARACRDRLRLSEVRMLGTVLNGIARFRRYGKRYHHYVAYAAGEGDDGRAGTAASA
jgi:Mrp family chromosome partitioning ATPase